MCLQVLLELSDVELEVGLGITHPMHRKKLRLAIEEHRHPALVRYPCIAQLGHTWVSSEWLPDLGLAQVSAMFHGCYRANILYSFPNALCSSLVILIVSPLKKFRSKNVSSIRICQCSGSTLSCRFCLLILLFIAALSFILS